MAALGLPRGSGAVRKRHTVAEPHQRPHRCASIYVGHRTSSTPAILRLHRFNLSPAAMDQLSPAADGRITVRWVLSRHREIGNGARGVGRPRARYLVSQVTSDRSFMTSTPSVASGSAGVSTASRRELLDSLCDRVEPSQLRPRRRQHTYDSFSQPPNERHRRIRFLMSRIVVHAAWNSRSSSSWLDSHVLTYPVLGCGEAGADMDIKVRPDVKVHQLHVVALGLIV